MMLDILIKAIETHAGANGGPTDNDIRRSEELEEARDQGLPRIREVTGRVGKELRGKHVRTREDCRAGGEASIRKRKKDMPKYMQECADGGRIGGTNSSTAYGTADAETDGRSVEMGNTRAAGRHAARSATAGTSDSWADGVRWECTKCEEKGRGGAFREEEVGKVRLPRHRKKVGHAWKSCEMKLPSHPEADIPIDNVQWVGLEAKNKAASRKRKAQKAAK